METRDVNQKPEIWFSFENRYPVFGFENRFWNLFLKINFPVENYIMLGRYS